MKTFQIFAWYIWLGTGAVCNLWDILWESITVAQVVTQLLFCNCILTNISNGVGHGTGNYGHYGTQYKFSWNDAGVSYIAFGLLILLFVILFIFFSVYTQGELDKARLEK